jgi:ABC-type lipoprotein export system ATPase subunit
VSGRAARTGADAHDLILDYAKQSGATLLTVTHDHDLLERFERVIDIKEFGVIGGDER